LPEPITLILRDIEALRKFRFKKITENIYKTPSPHKKQKQKKNLTLLFLSAVDIYLISPFFPFYKFILFCCLLNLRYIPPKISENKALVSVLI